MKWQLTDTQAYELAQAAIQFVTFPNAPVQVWQLAVRALVLDIMTLSFLTCLTFKNVTGV